METSTYIIDQPTLTVLRIVEVEDLVKVADAINSNLNLFPQLKGLPVKATVNKEMGVICTEHDPHPIVSIGDFMCSSTYSSNPSSFVLIPGKGRLNLPVEDIPSHLYFTPLLTLKK